MTSEEVGLRLIDGYNIKKASDLLKSDRRFTCDEIAREVAISKGSYHYSRPSWNEEGSSSLGTPSSEFGSNLTSFRDHHPLTFALH